MVNLETDLSPDPGESFSKHTQGAIFINAIWIFLCLMFLLFMSKIFLLEEIELLSERGDRRDSGVGGAPYVLDGVIIIALIYYSPRHLVWIRESLTLRLFLTPNSDVLGLY